MSKFLTIIMYLCALVNITCAMDYLENRGTAGAVRGKGRQTSAEIRDFQTVSCDEIRTLFSSLSFATPGLTDALKRCGINPQSEKKPTTFVWSQAFPECGDVAGCKPSER